jgi:hypothetical protein
MGMLQTDCGDSDRCGFRGFPPAGSCIVRPREAIVVRRSGAFHRLQFGAAKRAVEPTTLSGLQSVAFATKDEPSCVIYSGYQDGGASTLRAPVLPAGTSFAKCASVGHARGD